LANLAVDVPPRLDALAASRLANALRALVGAAVIDVDFGRLRTVDPFALVYLAGVSRQLRGSGVSFNVLNAEKSSYPAFMGLLREFDSAISPIQITAQHDDRYIPLTSVSRIEIDREARETLVFHPGVVIERHALRLARILSRDSDEAVTNALTYCLREIMRNAYEHSGAGEVIISAQYSPSYGRVDAALGDVGIGIRESIIRNPRVSAATDLEAIEVALLPGVSGSAMGANSSDPWENTGYGLFMAQRICREGGVFTIASGTGILRLTGDRATKKEGPPVGTVVGMTMRLDLLADLRRKLPEFSREGGKISKALGRGNVSASAASVSLRMTEDEGEDGD
jgi:anti-sigma regulatory factor (Ser/Thr protein kinase)